MATVEAKISGVTYRVTNTISLTQQAGAVAEAHLDLDTTNKGIPQSLQSVQVTIDGTPVFAGIINSVERPTYNSGYEPPTVSIDAQSLEVIFNFRTIKRNWYNKYIHEIVQDIFASYLAEEGLTLGAISTTTLQIPSYKKNNDKISSILDDLVKRLNGASYYISADKKFYFLVASDFPSVTKPAHITNLKLRESYSDLRTVQIVKGASATINGQATADTLKAAIAALSGTSGKIENILSDSTIRNPTAAAAKAVDTLAKYEEREKTITCKCHELAPTALYSTWAFQQYDYTFAGFSGLFTVVQRTITMMGNKLQIAVTLKNRNYFARYGYSIKQLADATQSTGDTLAEIASDGKYTPSEKIQGRKDWTAIADEKAIWDAQAEVAGVTTEKAAYDGAFQTLATYLNDGETWTTGLPAWLDGDRATETEDIVCDNFLAAWSNYYIAKEQIIAAIADATAKAAAADATAKADLALLTAKGYADTKASAASTESRAYADGLISAEEQRAIADAQAKADAARDAAIAAAAADATSKAASAQSAAQTYAEAKATAAETSAKAHADGIVSAEEARAIADAQAKADAAQAAAVAAAATDAQARVDAAKLLTEGYADAAAELAETTAKAYADGLVTAEEQRAIADAQAKADAARQAAITAALEKGPGSNMFPQADFPKGWTGWTYGGLASTEAGNNHSPTWALGGNTDPNNTNGLNTPYFAHGARSTGGYGQFESYPIYGLAAGKRYLVSVYSGAHRCKVGIYLFFYDASGTFLGYAGDTTPSFNDEEAHGGQLISGYKRIFAYATAPTGTHHAFVILRKWDTKGSEANSYAFFCRAQVEEVSDYTTQPGPWTPYATGTYVGKLEAYAQAQAALAQTTAQAYADGIVTAEEQRAIADATAKANAARDAAIAAAAADSTTKSAAAQAAAEAYALAQANLAQTAAQSYADGAVDAEEARAIADAAAKADAAQAAAIAAAQADATAKANAAQAAAEAYAAAQAELARTTAQAYADGIVDAEESRAIADAQAKADAARDAAIAAAAADATAKANAAQAAAEAYTRSATKYLTALTTQGDFQGQLGLFAGRIYRWTGAVWDPQDAIIPTDTPALYLSFDDVPDIPDDPAGTLYRSDFSAGIDGWDNDLGTISVVNGVLRGTMGPEGGMNVKRFMPDYNGKVHVYLLRANKTLTVSALYWDGGTYQHAEGSSFVLGTEWQTITFMGAGSVDTLAIFNFNTTEGSYIEIRDAYVGTGAYLTPAIDNSGKLLHGSNGGAVSCPGVSGKAVRFNGSKVVNLGNSAGNMGASSFTISAWVKGAPSGFTVFKRGNGYSNGFGFRGPSAYFISASPDNELYASFGSSFPSGWNSLIAVYDRVNHVMKAYLNGVLVSSTSLLGYTNPIDNFHPLIIGGTGTEWGSEMSSADIDEVSIFPRALTDSEIRGLYLAKSLPKLYTMADYRADALDDDGKLTPSDKQELLAKWKTIYNAISVSSALTESSTTQDGEYSAIVASAVALSVSTAAYLAAANALRDYLWGTSGVLNSMTTISTVTPGTLDAYLAAYRTAHQALVAAISAKQAENAQAGALAALPTCRGLYPYGSAPASLIDGDLIVWYSTTTANCGIYKYASSGSTWAKQTTPTADQIGKCFVHVLNAVASVSRTDSAGNTITVAYGTSADYVAGSTSFETLLVNFLYALNIVMGPGGSIRSYQYDDGAKGFLIDSETGNIDIRGGSFSGQIDSTALKVRNAFSVETTVASGFSGSDLINPLITAGIALSTNKYLASGTGDFSSVAFAAMGKNIFGQILLKLYNSSGTVLYTYFKTGTYPQAGKLSVIQTDLMTTAAMVPSANLSKAIGSASLFYGPVFALTKVVGGNIHSTGISEANVYTTINNALSGKVDAGTYVLCSGYIANWSRGGGDFTVTAMCISTGITGIWFRGASTSGIDNKLVYASKTSDTMDISISW